MSRRWCGLSNRSCRNCGARGLPRPAPCLWIVGLNPSPSVLALAGPDVREFTGRVPDVRPYLKHAQIAVAPLQIGRGVQNKVLEAMAMGLPVVATPQAREGLDSCQDDELLTAASPAEFAAAIGRVLSQSRRRSQRRFGERCGGRHRGAGAGAHRPRLWLESVSGGPRPAARFHRGGLCSRAAPLERRSPFR